MSERIVDDPSLHGWVEEGGKWVWDGQSAGSIEDGDTEGQITTWSGAGWTPESTVIVDGGNLGVGGAPDSWMTASGNSLQITSDSTTRLLLQSNGADGKLYSVTSDSRGRFLIYDGTTQENKLEIKEDGSIELRADSSRTDLAIDSSGDATFSGAVTAGGRLTVDSGSTSLMGDFSSSQATARIKIAGADASWGIATKVAAGSSKADVFAIENNSGSGDGNALTIDATGNVSVSGSFNVISQSASHTRFSSADAGGSFIGFDDPNTTGGWWHQGIGVIGNDLTLKTANQERLIIDASGNSIFNGTVDAAGFTVNGQPIGGGGLPDGDFTHNGKITATDFIATSDERVKDNITTAPVGLIDSLKGREWDWKESGKKGSGVVAQELEQVLPHLVHTDDDGMKSVAYNGLIAYLIEEVKALRAEVEALK